MRARAREQGPWATSIPRRSIRPPRMDPCDARATRVAPFDGKRGAASGPRQLAMQPATGHLPVAIDGPRRDVERLRDLVDLEAGEELELHDPRLTRVQGRELLQGF